MPILAEKHPEVVVELVEEVADATEKETAQPTMADPIIITAKNTFDSFG